MIALLTKPVLYGLAAALAGSLLANIVLTRQWLDTRDELAAAASDLRQARGAAQQCSDGVADLRRRADDAEKKAATARREAAAARADRNRKADQIISAPPSQPGNDCASAADRFNRYLGVRP